MNTRRTLDTYSKVTLTVIAACLLWLCVVNTNAVPVASAQMQATRDGVGRVIDAEAFRIVDKDGRVRAMLTLHPGKKAEPFYEDKVGLYLYSRQGDLSGQFIISDDRAQLSLRDGKANVDIGITKRQMNGDQGGFVYVSDAKKRFALLGTEMHLDKMPAPASSLKLFDNDLLKPFWQTPDSASD